MFVLAIRVLAGYKSCYFFFFRELVGHLMMIILIVDIGYKSVNYLKNSDPHQVSRDYSESVINWQPDPIKISNWWDLFVKLSSISQRWVISCIIIENHSYLFLDISLPSLFFLNIGF